jgi:hypothetical protein
MPLWIAEELNVISELFPDVKNWHKRFKELGGIPRYVFDRVDLEPSVLIRQACIDYNLENCLRIASAELVDFYVLVRKGCIFLCRLRISKHLPRRHQNILINML